MKLDVKIVDTKYNELLKRKEVFFMVSHERGPTPTRKEVREKIANLLKADVDRIYVVKMKTRIGTMTTRGEAHIYNSPDQAEILEPKHIITRNTPKKGESEG
ncbi:MAG: 30S ribosomal protein S24e [Candidatus Bathyarchaeia archaeon]